jgi:hypothetical protein
MLTGYKGELVEAPPFRPKHPDFRAVVARVLGERRPGLPVHAVLPTLRGYGSAYLGSSVDPLIVRADPSAADIRVPNLSLPAGQKPRFQERLTLLQRFDRMRRELDTSGATASLDAFHQKAVDLLTGSAARNAFDLTREPARVRERYGRHAVGQRCLLARRLIVAGARVVTVDFPCVPGQKAFSWDDHASVWNIFEQMKIRLPVLDQVVSALVEDLYGRCLDRDVLLVVMGEMSHTPKLSNFKGQPGREHWAQAMSIFLSGGGMPMGQVIGETNSRGEEPRRRPLTPNDVLATWYKFLGVPLATHFNDFTGRPTPILPHGRPIKELI